MDSANIERISKALANETRLLIFEAISRTKEITSSVCESESALRSFGAVAETVSGNSQELWKDSDLSGLT
jgi:DNA-binding transcriptional ArsR family regulator